MANGNGTDLMSKPRVEQFDQLVRALLVIMFGAGMLYGFVVSKVVSTESFLIVASTAFTWWFKSRDDDKKDAAIKAATAPNGLTPTGGTTP